MATHINQFNGRRFWIPVIALSLLLFAGMSWLDMRPELTIYKLAADGNVKLLNQQVAAGADVNEPDEQGYSPLHYAILNRSDSAAGSLLAAGANLNRETPAGDTPLHLAVAQGDIVLAEKLLAAGAHVNVLNKDGVSPLHLAVESNSPLVRPLLRAGAVPNNDNCPSGGYIFCAARCGCVVMLEELLLGLEDVNRPSQQGVSALHYAVYGKHIDAIRFLLEHGADINARDGHGRTPLHQVARAGSLEMIGLLVENGADMEARDDRGSSPLLVACRVGDCDCVRELVKRGADIDAIDDEKHTVDYFARANHSVDIRIFMEESRRALALRRSKPIL